MGRFLFYPELVRIFEKDEIKSIRWRLLAAVGRATAGMRGKHLPYRQQNRQQA